MNFGSKFVYNYSDSEEEYVSDDEFDEGMTRVHSDSDEDKGRSSDREVLSAACVKAPMRQRKSASLFGRLFKTSSREESPPKPPKMTPRQSNKKKHHWLSAEPTPYKFHGSSLKHGKKWRRADTNVISVNFDTLKKPSNMHTGDPFYCSSCRVVLSKLSKLVPTEDSNHMWICEFCGKHNLVDLVDEEIPSSDDVTFLLSPAPCTTESGRSGEDASLVVFCVDTSGSMCVTTEVPGNVNLRGSRLERLQSLNDTGESQYLPRQRKNVTYVSRLQGVQAAVDHQLEEMLKEHGSRRVALITFDSEVTFIGDGTSNPVHVSGDKLSNKDELIKIGTELSLPSHISQTRNKLGDRIFDLEEGGQTALGPALLISISMACQVPGSKVIICTDGMANVGLGNLDQLGSTEEAYVRTSAFFDEVSSMASGKGVSVSVISIKGTDCKMVELGRIADATGGQVNIVDPLKLTQEFGNILADPIIATNVSATLHLHNGLYFRHEESEQSHITRFVGNVTKDSEVTFEYGVRRQVKKKDKNPTDKQMQPENKETPVTNDTPRSDAVVYDVPRPQPVSYQNLPTSVEVTSQHENLYDNNVSTATPQQTGDVPTMVGNVDIEGVVVSSSSPADTSAAKPETREPVAMETKNEAGPSSAQAQGASAQVMEEDKREKMIASDLKELPFQLRIKYLDLDGAEALRVITQTKPVTRDRIQAENEMNMEAIGAHACKKSAALALKGDYTPSRLNAFMYQRLLHRKATVSHDTEVTDVYDNFYANALPMENIINDIQSSERRRRGVTYSDEEDCEEEDLRLDDRPKKLKAKAAAKPKSMQRRIECDDTSANVFYTNLQVKSKGLKKK